MIAETDELVSGEDGDTYVSRWNWNVVVAPAGIEPASSESESEILSIVLRNHEWWPVTGNQVAGWVQHSN